MMVVEKFLLENQIYWEINLWFILCVFGSILFAEDVGLGL